MYNALPSRVINNSHAKKFKHAIATTKLTYHLYIFSQLPIIFSQLNHNYVDIETYINSVRNKAIYFVVVVATRKHAAIYSLNTKTAKYIKFKFIVKLSVVAFILKL